MSVLLAPNLTWLNRILGRTPEGTYPYPMPGRFFSLSRDGRGVLHRDAQLALYHRQKVAIRRQHPERCGQLWAQADPRLPKRTLEALAAMSAQRITGEIGGTTAQAALVRWTEEIQEDLVVMTKAPSQSPAEARLAYVHVCFPSGWEPERTLGADFEQLHLPVPAHDRFPEALSKQESRSHGLTARDSQGLPSHAASHSAGAQRSRLAAALFSGTPRVRYVWTVTPDEALDRHPRTGTRTLWDAAERLYLRVERQVTVPVDAGLGLFLIRVYVWDTGFFSQQARAQLSQAIEQLPEPMARYKGLAGWRSHILTLV